MLFQDFQGFPGQVATQMDGDHVEGRLVNSRFYDVNKEKRACREPGYKLNIILIFFCIYYIKKRKDFYMIRPSPLINSILFHQISLIIKMHNK